VAAKLSDYALDSYALVAYLEGEKAMPRIKEFMQIAESGECSLYLSLINLGEVLYLAERERGRVKALQTLASIDHRIDENRDYPSPRVVPPFPCCLRRQKRDNSMNGSVDPFSPDCPRVV
jgi:hypothetical protein